MGAHRTGLDFGKREQLKQLLLGVAKGVDGACVYNDGWDDQRVADALPFPCTRHNVARMRAKELGMLRPKGPAVAVEAADTAVLQLLNALRLLTERHEALAHRVTRLESALNLRRAHQPRFDFERKGS